MLAQRSISGRAGLLKSLACCHNSKGEPVNSGATWRNGFEWDPIGV